VAVIGVGSAMRAQKKAADATRSRSDRGGRFDGEALPEVEGTAACATCGAETPRAEMSFTEAGSVCLSCEAEGTALAVAAAAPSAWLTTLGESLLPLPSLGLAALITLPVVTGDVVGRASGGWVILWCGVFIAAALAGLAASRNLVDARRARQLADDEATPQLPVLASSTGLTLAVAGWGVAGNVAASVWAVLLMAWMFL